jgi:alanyl-tRNA synthetase
MTSNQIRQSFLDFFRERGHTIVPSSSLLPESPNLLFTNAGMNQFVPIFLGERKCPYQPARAANTQKCIRAGGKHNDLDDVGLDTYHHTFFEMLGNWSFGDYFKTEAIEWAWELITKVWKFPKNRLYATVYKPGEGEPAEFDAEAHETWSRLFAEAGLDPSIHVLFFGKKDNFWMMGETGPCGPCSELHVDLTSRGDTRGALVNKGSSECIEIWNLVFIQFNANPDGSFSPLPSRHVDTGMGFERVTAILQCTKNFTDFSRAVSNYDSDIFRPIFDKLEHISGRQYLGTLPDETSLRDQPPQIRTDIAFRVIADHIRTVAFAIADGILPGNTDRHYVLRRILRRAVRYGRNLGLHDPFFYKLVQTVAQTMGEVFPEIRERRAHIEEVIRLEEEAFNRTLDKGIALFREEIERTSGDISGEFAFKLYDTYGFPLDLTQLMAREYRRSVDEAEFESLMEEQRRRARAARKTEVIELTETADAPATVFLGFSETEIPARVLRSLGIKGRPAVILDRTVCYAEMGGQVGDTGEIDSGGQLWIVTDTRKVGAAWLHFLQGSEAPSEGSEITIRIDRARRAAIERHHTATHLLHWAIHEVVSRDASQKGSFVGPEKLTFDFNHSALSAGQVADIERLVNERILANEPVSWTEVEYEAIKSRGDIQQFFADKYGNVVRVVQIGGKPGALDGFSMELCGGTHVRRTGELGMFRILGESAIAAGIRRVEAVCGLVALENATNDARRLAEIAHRLNTPASEIEKKIDALQAHQKALEKALQAASKRIAESQAMDLLGRAIKIGGVPLIVAECPETNGDGLQLIAAALKGRFEGVVALLGEESGRVHLLVQTSPAFQSCAPAGKIVQAMAPHVGGKGGGKPDLARGGGSSPAGIPAAIEAVRAFVGGSGTS